MHRAQRVKFRSNNNIVFSCNYHVIFCPKYRRKVLLEGVDVRLKEILLEVASETNTEILEMEVMPDHVHLIISVDPQLGVRKIVRLMKGRSSHHLRMEFAWLRSRIPTLWTNSYFVASVGGAPLSIIKKYIEEQKHV